MSIEQSEFLEIEKRRRGVFDIELAMKEAEQQARDIEMISAWLVRSALQALDSVKRDRSQVKLISEVGPPPKKQPLPESLAAGLAINRFMHKKKLYEPYIAAEPYCPYPESEAEIDPLKAETWALELAPRRNKVRINYLYIPRAEKSLPEASLIAMHRDVSTPWVPTAQQIARQN